jgi:hypothetical protein
MTDYVIGVRNFVGKEDFETAVSTVKGQCRDAAKLLIVQLDKKFPNCKIKEALNVVLQ